MSWFQGGSKTTSTFASPTSGQPSSRFLRCPAPARRPCRSRGRSSVILIATSRRPSAPRLGELAVVDQAELDDVDRDLRVVAAAQDVPDPVLERSRFLRRRIGRHRSLEPERVEALRPDPEQPAEVGAHGGRIAERLQHAHARAFRQVGTMPLGDDDRLDVARQGELFAAGRHGVLRRREDTPPVIISPAGRSRTDSFGGRCDEARPAAAVARRCRLRDARPGRRAFASPGDARRVRDRPPPRGRDHRPVPLARGRQLRAGADGAGDGRGRRLDRRAERAHAGDPRRAAGTARARRADAAAARDRLRLGAGRAWRSLLLLPPAGEREPAGLVLAPGGAGRDAHAARSGAARPVGSDDRDLDLARRERRAGRLRDLPGRRREHDAPPAGGR